MSRARHSLRFRAVYGLWQIAVHLLLPLAVLHLLWRSRREPAYRRGFAHRLGLWPRIPAGSIWVFAASAGETRAAGPVIERLLDMGHHIALAHSTPAGLETAHRMFGDDPRVVSHYAPLDLFWAVRQFLSRVRPALLIVVEIELWPAMLIETARAGVPLAHINGNLVSRSIARDRARTGGARLALYRLFDVICTKTDDFAARFRDIGVAPDRVRVVGELKFDQPVSAEQTRAATGLRETWGAGRQVVTITSSVQGEEPDFAALIADLHRLAPAPRIVWVPRSPGRFDAVAEICRTSGWNRARRSAALDRDLAGPLPHDCDILIGDSLGEMDFYIALADLVIVGGSLVDHGGHNIMEPLAQGKPVLMGPSIFGIRFAADAATRAGAFQSLANAAALRNRAAALLSGDPDLARMTSAARAFTTHHTGAADLTVAALRPYLPRPTP
ncbi:3-deoxy-D-manno-octulosonic acid transferase [Oceaniglobus indicus]|uniref:3-deoxy-D-manno-octulosonic acid transferase n=1 Tax=Oceaniglobus indicus TaxID=2047749 RepID=UPI0013040E2D|nr:glycosyltransferase N-terminal domain-containing protein [Oceaniglobus indicus]